MKYKWIIIVIGLTIISTIVDTIYFNTQHHPLIVALVTFFLRSLLEIGIFALGLGVGYALGKLNEGGKK